MAREVTVGRRDRIADRARVWPGEWLPLSLFIVGLLLVTGLPVLFASLSAPPDRVFMGIVLNVPDTAQYLAWARESTESVLIENKLTPDAGTAVFFNLFWFLFGRLAGLLGLTIPQLLQVARLTSGVVYLLALFWFIRLVTASALERWTSYLVITLGGGLGWVLVLAKQVTGDLPMPLVVYVIESNTFLTIMGFPHQAMATGLMVVALGLAALAFERDSARLAGAAGLVALALGFQHGYDLLHVYAFVGVMTLVLAWRGRWRLRPWLLGALICVPSLPAALYLASLTRLSPIWRGVLAQYGNAGVYTPAPGLLLLTLGLPLILLLIVRPPAAPAGALPAREVLLRVWLLVGFALLYVPTDFQIKMLAGWQVPVSILAVRLLLRRLAPAMERVMTRWRRPALTSLAVATLAVMVVIPTNLYLISWRFVELARYDYPYYLHRDEVAALAWLDANAAPSDVILSSLTIGQYVPSLTGSHAYLAHWAMTLDYYTRRQAVADFFATSSTDSARRQTLQEAGVRYVVHGPAERALGGYQPADAPFLRPVFRQGVIMVFQVREDG